MRHWSHFMRNLLMKDLISGLLVMKFAKILTRINRITQFRVTINSWSRTGPLKDQQHIKVPANLGSWFL